MARQLLRYFSTSQPSQLGPLHLGASLRIFRIKAHIRLFIPSYAAVEQFSGLTPLIVGTRPVKQSPVVPNDEVATLPFVFVNSWWLTSKRLQFS